MNRETVNYLKQTKSYLETITPADYSQPIEQLSNGTIGQHTRHFLECYQCLISQYPSGEICYDERARNLKIETSPKFALGILNSIIEKIMKVGPNKSLILKSILPNDLPIKTSFNRELLYNYEHTTHHLALIRVGLILLKSDVQIAENFGVAKSTIEHHKKVVLNN